MLDNKIMLKKAISDFILETLRTAVVAVLVYLIPVLQVMANTGKFEINWMIALGIFLLSIVKAADRTLHNLGLLS